MTLVTRSTVVMGRSASKDIQRMVNNQKINLIYIKMTENPRNIPSIKMWIQELEILVE